MSEYIVVAFVNVDPSFSFRPLAPRDHIAKVDEFHIKAASHEHAAEGMFVVGNRMGCDIHGREWPHDVRSLSVGDLVAVTSPAGYRRPEHRFYAVDRVGWTEIPEPANRVVPIEGTPATSREAATV